MTLNEALAAVRNVPASKRNCNCVQDAQARLTQDIGLALNLYSLEDDAPGYVVERVRALKSWIDHRNPSER